MANGVGTKNNDSLGEQVARRLAASACRAGWGWSLLNLAWSAAMAHRLAREMVRFFNVPLNESSITYLVEHYGASEEYLHNLAAKEQEEPILASTALEENIHELSGWQQLIKR